MDYYKPVRKYMNYGKQLQERASGSVNIEGLTEEIALEERPEEW